ncbi:hypothetical protein ABT248_31545 [Streptomyces sp. NPDC000971]|uniref:hypothetical protein n=1 Tax=Streptomyces sp. NPDC000971 TaxID=3156647 RepID=UPI0033177F97
MFNPMRRRPAAAAATPLRRALHATAVTCSSVALGVGTTLLGANAIEATGIGLATLPVVTTFFPVPPRGSRTGSQIASGTRDSVVTDENGSPAAGTNQSAASPIGGGAKTAHSPAHDTPASPRTAAAAPTTAGGAAGLGPVHPGSADEAMYDAVMVWEPRLQIKPRVTVFPAHIEEEDSAAPAPVPPPVPESEPGNELGNES